MSWDWRIWLDELSVQGKSNRLDANQKFKSGSFSKNLQTAVHLTTVVVYVRYVSLKKGGVVMHYHKLTVVS